MKIDFHYLQMMDKILSHMASKPDEVPLSPDLICQRAGIEIEKTLAFMMCAKMSRDGYLQRHDNIRYSLYAEGFFFIKTGGYSTTETRERKKANLQSLQTWAIVVGTFLAGVYGLVEILKRFFQC
jgi:hypothetical protein